MNKQHCISALLAAFLIPAVSSAQKLEQTKNWDASRPGAREGQAPGTVRQALRTGLRRSTASEGNQERVQKHLRRGVYARTYVCGAEVSANVRGQAK